MASETLAGPKPAGRPGPAEVSPLATDVGGDPSLQDTLAGEGRAPKRDLADHVAPGTKVGRYVVLERVGSGGMGVVFAAFDPDLDRRVALKVLRARVSKSSGASEGRARLLREAQAMAKLHHENVIAVHDVGTVGERVFIAMEFIDGRTLGDWVRDDEPAPARVLEVFTAAGRGLVAAHDRGLIHRDFKPDNVLLGDDGRVCVVDFGLARRNDPSGVGLQVLTDPGDPAATKPGSGRGALGAAGLNRTVSLATPGRASRRERRRAAARAADERIELAPVAPLDEVAAGRPSEPWLASGGVALDGAQVADADADPEEATADDKGLEGLAEAAPVAPGTASRLPRQVTAPLPPATRGKSEDAAGEVDNTPRGKAEARERDHALGNAATCSLPSPEDDPPLSISSTGGGHGSSDRLASSLTRTGVLVGTPAYMAPEQHLGAPASDRSDQFSFCVSLYEALYRQRPFAGNSHAELVVNITEGAVRSPPPDTQVSPRLRRVILRGLALDPGDRWPSMQALLDALAHDPVPRRRRRVLMAGGGAVALSLTAALGTFFVDGDERCAHAADHLRGVWDDEARDHHAARFESAGKAWTHDAWPGVAAAIDRWADAWVAEREEACKATHVRGEQSAELLDLRMECLDAELASLRVLTELLDENDLGVLEAATDAVQRLPDPAHCGRRDHLQRRRITLADPDEREMVRTQRRALDEARSLAFAQRPEPAMRRVSRALDIARRLDYRPLEAEALLLRAEVYEASADLDAARQSMRAGLLTAEAVGDDRTVAQAWIDLVWVDGYRRADYDAGHDAAEHAQAVLDRIGGDASLEALLVSRLGDLHYSEGRYESSLGWHQRALELFVEIDGPRHPDVADSHTGIGHALVELGRYHEALVHHREAMAILAETFGERHPFLAVALTNVGVVHEYLGDLDASRQTHERALEVAEAAYGSDHSAVADVLNNYASVLHLSGDNDAAQRAYERARAIWERAYGPEHPDVAMATFNLAMVAFDRGELDRSLSLLERARALGEAAQGADHPVVGGVVHEIGLVHEARGSLASARAALQTAWRIRSASLGPDHPSTEETTRALARVEAAGRVTQP